MQRKSNKNKVIPEPIKTIEPIEPKTKEEPVVKKPKKGKNYVSFE